MFDFTADAADPLRILKLLVVPCSLANTAGNLTVLFWFPDAVALPAEVHSSIYIILH